ncbi:MAG: DUF1127 domain-containing protein [Burkholderiales bacterium]|nr:DUF1127 domain-containing protein [Burkholderiales bacterium]
MTTQQATISIPGNRAFTALGRTFGTVADGLRAKWRAHRTRAELEALDGRMLRDIGIDYSDVLVLTTHGTDAITATRQRVIHRRDRS